MLHGELAHRLTRVLRLDTGTHITLFDGAGREWDARIGAVSQREVRVSIGAGRSLPAEPPTALLAALIRPQRFEWLIEKATELGATLIQPLLCEYGAVHAAEIGAARRERWRRIAVEAAEQSGRAVVPEVCQPLPLAAVLGSAWGRLCVAMEPRHGPVPPLGPTLAGIGAASVGIVIGPEGGLSPGEVAAALAAGAQPVTLGPQVLRAETAAIAALAVLQDARGNDDLHHGGSAAASSGG